MKLHGVRSQLHVPHWTLTKAYADGYMYRQSPERVISTAEAEVQSKRPRLPCSFRDNMFLLDKYDSHGKWLKKGENNRHSQTLGYV